ncbi:hypothetical protein [Mesorhizobium mediterraneum]|uniref:hypothetical protein n=1 Tax=Mesorhizobium mediterraneum TaxID=43617 RepID=UPI0032B72FFE
MHRHRLPGIGSSTTSAATGVIWPKGGVPKREDLPHGFNDFGNLHYDGPDQHPGDKPHTYRFRLAALGIAKLPIGSEPDALVVWQAARENMLGEAELIGTYG